MYMRLYNIDIIFELKKRKRKKRTHNIKKMYSRFDARKYITHSLVNFQNKLSEKTVNKSLNCFKAKLDKYID